ncbi:MAG: hypothetical protein ABGW83_02380 [Flavobacteriaceae bacterium]
MNYCKTDNYEKTNSNLTVSFNLISQVTYKDLMSISSVDIFKKVVIENGYEFNDNGWVTYGYDIMKDSINGNKSSKWTSYNIKDNRWSFRFSKAGYGSLLSNVAKIEGMGVLPLLGALLSTASEQEDEENETDDVYDVIFEEVKEKCKYYKILNYNGTDYVSYSCADSSYKGKIGFMVAEGFGYISHFPPE